MFQFKKNVNPKLHQKGLRPSASGPLYYPHIVAGDVYSSSMCVQQASEQGTRLGVREKERGQRGALSGAGGISCWAGKGSGGP